MNSNQDVAALQSHFALQWSILNPDTVVYFENSPAAPPPENAHWLRFAVQPSSFLPVSFGTSQRRYEGAGRVEIQIFAPRGAGTALRDTLADEAAGIFRNWRSGDGAVECNRGAELSTPPADEREAWSMRRVSIPYLSRRLA